jgi:hypothetical protein
MNAGIILTLTLLCVLPMLSFGFGWWMCNRVNNTSRRMPGTIIWQAENAVQGDQDE